MSVVVAQLVVRDRNVAGFIPIQESVLDPQVLCILLTLKH